MAQAGDGPIAILAGSGHLPIALADALRASGRDGRVLAFRGFADRRLRMRADAVVDLLDISGALRQLEVWRPSGIALAGAVSRPSPSAVLNAVALIRNRREIGELLARGDDQLLRGVVALLEERGYRILGAHEIAPDLLPEPGLIGKIAPGEEAARSIALGLRCLADLSPYDVGQGLVVLGARVTAIEGAEGTDRMLDRVRALNRSAFGRLREHGSILVKCAKRGQDQRVDLPAIGPQTVAAAARAGLAGVAVGARRTLVLERERTAREADRLGLFVVAVDEQISESA